MGRWIGIGVGIILAIVAAFIIAASLFPDFRVASRDIAIALIAVFQLIIALLTIVILLVLLYAIKFTRTTITETLVPRLDAIMEQLNQILNDTKAAANTVKDSAVQVSTATTFVSDHVVAPVIRVAGLMAGVQAAVKSLVRRSDPSAGAMGAPDS